MKITGLTYDWGYMTLTLYGGEVIDCDTTLFNRAWYKIDEYFKTGIKRDWVEI